MTREDYMENFGENLQEILAEKKINQQMLSKMTGIPTSTISTYISGSSVPNIIAIVKIVYALDVDYFDLLDFSETIE
jgi:predicted transcriptional regulator